MVTIAYNCGKNDYKNWIVAETDFGQDSLGKYESIFSLGNGYMGLRAATEEYYINENRGNYIAGLFDQFPGEVTELTNIPDWLGMEIILAGEKFNLQQGEILSYSRKLNLKEGKLLRNIEWKSPQGLKTRLSFSRFVSLAELHLGGIKVTITPLNYSGKASIKTGFDGQVTNSGVQHFIEGDKRVLDHQLYYLTSSTQESNILVAMGAGHNIYYNGEAVDIKQKLITGRRQLFLTFEHNLEENSEFAFEKIIAVYSSRDPEFKGMVKNDEFQNLKSKEEMVTRELIGFLEEKVKQGYDHLIQQHQQKWAAYWEKMDIKIVGPDFDQLAIRFALFHLIQMTPGHDSRISIAAKGLSGEGYKGHVFWDAELFDIPFFTYCFPEIAKNLLIYRFHTLAGARKKAKDNGYAGAMYAWESASTGEEVTPAFWSVDVITGKPIKIWSGEIEQHITADVAKAVWDYYQLTGDLDFMYKYGVEIFWETARFWSDRLEYNISLGRYEISDVIGPDEYSEHVDNDAFTNYMVQWHLLKAAEIAIYLEEEDACVYKELISKIKLKKEEIADWQEKARKLYTPYDPATDIIIQHDGFMEKKALDISSFTGKAGEIIEKIGWEEVTKSQVIKQADVVMLLYQLNARFSQDTKRKNYHFYEQRTLHDSSLSPSIHAILAADIDEPDEAYQYFKKACRIDLGENMKSSDDGLHAASLGGIWQAVVNGFGGVRVINNKLSIDPKLPLKWQSLQFNFLWQGNEYSTYITDNKVVVKSSSDLKLTY